MRGAGQGAEHQVRPGQRRLGRDHPRRLLPGRAALGPGRGGGPPLARPRHAEALVGGRLPPRRPAGPPTHPPEDTARTAAACGRRAPGGAIPRQPTSRPQARARRLMVQRLAPGMQHAERAARGASVRGILGDRRHRLRHRLPPPGLHDPRMLPREGAQLGGDGTDHRARGDREACVLPRHQPGGVGPALTRGAVPIAAGGIAALLMPPGGTRRWMAPKDGRPTWGDGLAPPTLRRGRHRARAGEGGVSSVPDDGGHCARRAGQGWLSGAGAGGKGSRGLGLLDSAWGVTGSERLVVRRRCWPRRSWRRRPSPPASKKGRANAGRHRGGDTAVPNRAFAPASRQRRDTVCRARGGVRSWPGKSHGRGLYRCQDCRRRSSTRGESLTQRSCCPCPWRRQSPLRALSPSVTCR